MSLEERRQVYFWDKFMDRVFHRARCEVALETLVTVGFVGKRGKLTQYLSVEHNGFSVTYYPDGSYAIKSTSHHQKPLLDEIEQLWASYKRSGLEGVIQ